MTVVVRVSGKEVIFIFVYIYYTQNKKNTCCSIRLCFSSLSLRSLSSLSLLNLSRSLSSRSRASLSLCSSIGSGLIFHGVGGGKPGKLGGKALTLGGKFGTLLCNRQGSCKGPKAKSLVLLNGETPKGDVVDVEPKPLPYLKQKINGFK